MLAKLLKKDFKATCRFFIPLLCGYIVAALIGKILFETAMYYVNISFNSSVLNGITIFSIIYFTIFVFYLIACHVMTSVFIIFDFYKTMVSDHGYLTHTLPVKTSDLIYSKTLVGVFWNAVVNIVTVLFLLLIFTGHFPDIPFLSLLTSFIKTLNVNIITYSSFTLINIIIEWFNKPLMIFACIAIGQLWKNHRIVGAILAYIGIYIISQIINTIVLIMTTGSSFYFTGNTYGSSTYMSYSAIYGIITSIIFFLITQYFLSKHLNLE